MQPDNQPQLFSFSLFFKLIRLRIKFVAIAMSAITSLVIAYSYIMPYEYEATASLLPPKQESGGGGLSSFLQSMSGGLILGGGVQTNQSQIFAEMICSRIVAKYICESNQLLKRKQFRKTDSEDVFSLIRGMLDTKVDKTGLVYITAKTGTSYFSGRAEKDSARKFAALIANSAVKSLDYLIRNKNVSAAKNSKNYIERAIADYKHKLDSIEQLIQSFQTSNKVLSITEQTKSVLQQAIAIGADLTKAEIDYNLAKQEFNEKSPLVMSYKNTIELLKQQYNKIQSGGLLASDEFSIPLGEVPKLTKSYTILLRDQKILEQVLLYLETQHHQEAIQEQKDVPVVETLDDAIVPAFQSSPKRSFMLVFSLIFSFVISASYITYMAYRAGAIIFVKDLPKETNPKQ